jgi:hypothetical protein
MESHATSKMPPKKKQKKAAAVASAGDKTASPEDKKPEVKQDCPPNYSQLEDELLCRAYVNISTDPTVGTDQSGETFFSNHLTSACVKTTRGVSKQRVELHFRTSF